MRLSSETGIRYCTFVLVLVSGNCADIEICTDNEIDIGSSKSIKYQYGEKYQCQVSVPTPAFGSDWIRKKYSMVLVL